jgi:hypothetical protein
VTTEFTVIEGKGEPLLGRKAATELGVLKLQIPEQFVNSVTDRVARHNVLFQGIWKLNEYQTKLHIDPQVRPVAQSVRRTAFSLRGKIEEKLDELLREDIIEKVDGPTPWVNPVVVVPKANGEVRLCVDMRCANKAIISERHPIPTIDEILQDMQEGGVFSKLDLKWGYHQIELSEESGSITTFVTHKGLFRYKRLMFGISSAPEKYQQVIQQVLQDCSGTANISDDIIIYGSVFAATDYYSRYVEVNIAKRNTADVAIKSLENMFATHGLPWTVTSDNGPHFVAETFESFLQENGIEHRKTTPLWPQANGEIERQNRSLLKRMQIARVEGQDWRKAVQTYLIAYRNTPHPTTGISPAELMFRRKLRTKLPELTENVRLDDEEMRDKDREKEKMKGYADKRRNAKESNLS